MQQFDTIIIGGGLGGLTAGATLAKSGKKVLLLEQHYIPGGCATTFKRKDFIMEVGLHEMDGLFEGDTKLDIFKFLEVDKNVECIQVPELFHLKGKEIDFVHPHGYKESLAALIERFPEDEKGIRCFLKLMTQVLKEISTFPTARWKQLLLYPIMPLLFPSVVKVSSTSVAHWIDKYISNEELKLIILAQLLYYGDDPYTMSMTYFSAAQASYIGGGGHFIKGGSQTLSDYLSHVIEQNGGQVLLGKKATKIIIKDDKAQGVTYADSFNSSSPEADVFADTVIANAAIPLVKSLLPKKESETLGHKIEHLENACALFSIYIGFKKEVKDLGNKHYSTFILGDKTKKMSDINPSYKGDWENRNFVFVDYSQVDSGLAPKGKSFGAICTSDYISDWENLDPEAYAAKKEKVAQILFDRLEKEIPGIKEQIEYYEVGTAQTVRRFTLNPEGTAYGFAQTPKQSGMGRVPIKSPIKNLYFAGAWTFPGGGFTGAIISGFLCGRLVTKKLPQNKATSVSPIKDERIVKLLSKEEIADNTLEVSIEKPEGFAYTPGQYAVVEILNPKYKVIDTSFRMLSLVSHPDEQALRFTMRLSDSSSKKSIKEAEVGKNFRIFGPMGDFTLSESKKGIVFLISGIGITPVLPLLKELEKQGMKLPTHLFYSNKTEDAAAYHKQFQSVNLPEFSYHPVFTKTESRISEALLKDVLQDLQAFDYYLVGTKGFLETMKGILTSNNVAIDHIKMDDFG